MVVGNSINIIQGQTAFNWVADQIGEDQIVELLMDRIAAHGEAATEFQTQLWLVLDRFMVKHLGERV